MSEGLAKAFENLTGWLEYSHFEQEEEGYITQERVGEAVAFFIWRVDKDPAKLDAMYMDGKIFVRYSDNAH